MILDVVKVMTPATLAFFIGILLTPLVAHYLYKHRAWKKTGGKENAPIFNSLHKDREIKTPIMGGVIIWASVLVTISGVWLSAHLLGSSFLEKLDFLSRDQTWLPLFTLVVGAFVGLWNDIFEIKASERSHEKGISLSVRLLIVAVIGTFAAWWFYDKLEVASIGIPFAEDLSLGIFFIPFFVLVMLAVYAGGVIDGIDGLSGGVFATIFTAYAGIAFAQEQINLAAFSATVAGAILAFLWFNVPPARFYMSETGTMGLTLTLTVVAFLADTLGGGHGVFALPIIAFPLVATVASNIIQVSSKKLLKKKVFQVAPLHHHFEAIGWPSAKVTMRYWIISIMMALLGVIVALIGV
ncbi:MAG: hypothetical protein WDZ90_00605 [Candidatus Paceibacterota bacterium]